MALDVHNRNTLAYSNLEVEVGEDGSVRTRRVRKVDILVAEDATTTGLNGNANVRSRYEWLPPKQLEDTGASTDATHERSEKRAETGVRVKTV